MLALRFRAKAAGWHLLGSVSIASIAAFLVFGLWYPWPYNVLAGGTSLFVLVCTADVVMGPALTFVAFDGRKSSRELTLDLVIIAVLQLSALGYGLHTVFVARPVAMALESDRLRVVTASDVVAEELPLAPPELRHLSVRGPVLISTTVPSDPKERFEAVNAALAGVDLGMRPKYWRAWDDSALQTTRLSSRPLDELRAKHPNRLDELNRRVKEAGLNATTARFLPILSRHEDWVALIDSRTGSVAGFLPFGSL